MRVGYRTKNFNIQELVNPDLLCKLGEDEAWRILNAGLLYDIDLIREKWGKPLIINSIEWGFKNSGLRSFDCSEGETYSMHKYGCAFDLKVISCSKEETKELHNLVIEMSSRGAFCCLNTLESKKITIDNAKVGWVHVACQNNALNNELLIIN